MGSFWGGFAGTMKDQIGEQRTAGLAEDARVREQESRQKFLAEERALDRKEKLEDKNLDLKLKDSSDVTRIVAAKNADGTKSYTITKRSIDSNGNILIDTEQVTDSSLIGQYEAWTAEEENKKKKDAISLENAQVNLDADKKAYGYMDSEHRSRLEANNRVGRDSPGKELSPTDIIQKTLPPYMNTRLVAMANGDWDAIDKDSLPYPTGTKNSEKWKNASAEKKEEYKTKYWQYLANNYLTTADPQYLKALGGALKAATKKAKPEKAGDEAAAQPVIGTNP